MKNFIDIIKLNDEIEAVIAKQTAEIEESERVISAITHDGYNRALLEITRWGAVAEEVREKQNAIELILRTDIPSYNGETEPLYFSIRFFGYIRITQSRDRMDWYDLCGGNREYFVEKFHRDHDKIEEAFERKCLDCIRAKAEKSNAKYMAVLDRRTAMLKLKIDEK